MAFTIAKLGLSSRQKAEIETVLRSGATVTTAQLALKLKAKPGLVSNYLLTLKKSGLPILAEWKPVQPAGPSFLQVCTYTLKPESIA